jgi:hypothetical protein
MNIKTKTKNDYLNGMTPCDQLKVIRIRRLTEVLQREIDLSVYDRLSLIVIVLSESCIIIKYIYGTLLLVKLLSIHTCIRYLFMLMVILNYLESFVKAFPFFW